jgi:hypothetical protein
MPPSVPCFLVRSCMGTRKVQQRVLCCHAVATRHDCVSANDCTAAAPLHAHPGPVCIAPRSWSGCSLSQCYTLDHCGVLAISDSSETPSPRPFPGRPVPVLQSCLCDRPVVCCCCCCSQAKRRQKGGGYYCVRCNRLVKSSNFTEVCSAARTSKCCPLTYADEIIRFCGGIPFLDTKATKAVHSVNDNGKDCSSVRDSNSM